MKKFKFLFAVGTIAFIMNNTGCGVLATASAETKSLQQDNAVLNNMNDMIENEADLKPEGEITGQTADIIFNERGYTYSNIISGISNSSIEENGSYNIFKEESGYEGELKEETEIVLQWSDAQKYLEEDKLCWLNNEFLKACADDISFVTSNSDMVMANYSTPTSKIKVLVFIVLNNDEKNFEFGRRYTSELYNIHQVGEEKIWQCFSYNGYDGIEYTSAVLANKNILCEIVFENCDEQFICDTLAVY